MNTSVNDQLFALRTARENLDRQIEAIEESKKLDGPPYKPGDRLMNLGMYVVVQQVAYIFNRWLFLCYYEQPRTQEDRGKFFIFQASDLKKRNE